MQIEASGRAWPVLRALSRHTGNLQGAQVRLALVVLGDLVGEGREAEHAGEADEA